MQLKNVTLVAGSGQVGKTIIDALSKVDHDFVITVTTREGSSRPQWLPSEIKTVVVDYESRESLASALKGQDALVALFNFPQVSYQNLLLDVAIEVGVKFFIPSEFGLDTSAENPCEPFMRKLPMYHPKLEFTAKLRAAADEGKITWSVINTGRFLDSGLQLPLLGFDFKNHSARIIDGGNRKLTTITMAQVGEATVQILLHPDEWSNRAAKISTLTVTQNELLAALEQRGTKQKWSVKHVDSATQLKEGMELVKTNRQAGLFAILLAITWDEGEKWSKPIVGDDADKLGLKRMTVHEMLDSIGF